MPAQLSAETRLDTLPATATLTQVWSALGADGLVAGLHPDGVLDPARLAELLTVVDDRTDNGITLAVLVQATSVVPQLNAAAAGHPATAVCVRAREGRSVVAMAATDAAAPGSDLTALGTQLTLGEHEVQLDGEKSWVTAATVADHLLVLARHRAGRHFTSFTWVLVPATAPGVRIRSATTDLLASSATGHVEFSGVRLPASYVIGRPGRGMVTFARGMAIERLGSALWAVALCRRVLADTHKTLLAREINGTVLWRNPAVRQRFATAVVRLHELRALIGTHATAIAREHDSTAGALLKAASGPTVEEVLSVCAQLQGARGFGPAGIQRIRAEAGVFGIGGGATELMLDAVADAAGPLLTKDRS